MHFVRHIFEMTSSRYRYSRDVLSQWNDVIVRKRFLLFAVTIVYCILRMQKLETQLSLNMCFVIFGNPVSGIGAQRRRSPPSDVE